MNAVPVSSRSNATTSLAASSLDVTVAAALGVMTLGVALFFAPRGFHLGFVDMGHDGYQLQQVLDLSRGGVIFRDTFDQYGPLNGYINLVGFAMFGRTLLAMKYFIAVWYGITAVVLFAMARRWLQPMLAGFSVVLWLALAPFYGHGIMVSPHAYALCFQAIATLIALRATDLQARQYAIVGWLAGLSWAVKQSIGVLFLMAILAYLAIRVVAQPQSYGRVLRAALSVSAAFFAVVGVVLWWLWSRGAIHDYYLQTIVFPREFYLSSVAPGERVQHIGVLAQAVGGVLAFARLQLTESALWIVLRLSVVFAAAVSLVRDRRVTDVVLVASITLLLWPAAYPSANFMHQWWTASLAIPMFVLGVRVLVERWDRFHGIVPIATVGVVAIVASADVTQRYEETRGRVRSLTATLSQPALLRGIRTDPSTARVFATFGNVATRYRAAYPGTEMVSIDAADGWKSGTNETLPFLAIFDERPHPLPVYWSLPALSNVVYPRYGESLWARVREQKPLIVDHRAGGYRPAHIAGYQVFAAAPSDTGYWYLYAPSSAEAERLSVYLAADGTAKRYFPEERILAPAQPVQRAVRRHDDQPSRFGTWRGQIVASAINEQDRSAILDTEDDPIVVTQLPPLGGAEPVNVYTWPAHLSHAAVGPSLRPNGAAVAWRAGRYDIVRDFRPDAWVVDGEAQRPHAYLVQWAEETVAAGATFVARGQVAEGGVEVGFLRGGQWVASVCVSKPGPFEGIVKISDAGRYALVVANCVTTPWRDRVKTHPAAAVLSLLADGHLPNRFVVTAAGWVDETDQ